MFKKYIGISTAVLLFIWAGLHVDRAHAWLPLGTATTVTATGCPSSVLPTTQCIAITSSSNPPGTKDGATATVPSLSARVKVSTPTGCTPSGLIIPMTGGGSTTAYETTWPATIAAGGTLINAYNRCQTIAQVFWCTGAGSGCTAGNALGPWAGTAGIVSNFVTAATVLHAVVTDPSIHVAGTPIFGTGNSGGCSHMAHWAGEFGGADDLDGYVCSGGPPIADVHKGCYGANPSHDLAWEALVAGGGYCSGASTTCSRGYAPAGGAQLLDQSRAASGDTNCSKGTNGGGVNNDAVTQSIGRGFQQYFPKMQCHFIWADGDAGEPNSLGHDYVTKIVACQQGAPTKQIATGADHNTLPGSTDGMAKIDAYFAAAAVGCTAGTPVTGCAGLHQNH